MTHDFSSGVGQGIDGMAETVYQALVASLEGFIEDLMDDFHNLVVRSLDADGIDDLFHHQGDTDVGAAVTRSFKGADGSCHTRMNIGVCRGNDDIGKGRVGTAAVVGMEKEQEVEELRFFGREFAVRAQHG